MGLLGGHLGAIQLTRWCRWRGRDCRQKDIRVPERHAGSLVYAAGGLLFLLRLDVSPENLSIWFFGPHNAEIADEKVWGFSRGSHINKRETEMGLAIMGTSKTELASPDYAMGNLKHGQHIFLRSHQINYKLCVLFI